MNETIQKHSKYKYTYYQNTHTIVLSKHPHITKPTHTHTNTLTHPHIIPRCILEERVSDTEEKMHSVRMRILTVSKKL